MPDLEDQLAKLLKENPRLKGKIDERPELYQTLKSQYELAYEKYRGIIRGGELVDRVDRVLGPVEAALRWFGPGPGYIASFGLRAIEEALFKIPYAINYTAKTRDIGALPGWIASEAAATVLPYGDIIDVAPIYKGRARSYVRKAAAQAFEDYLVKQGLLEPLEKKEPKRRPARRLPEPAFA